MKSLITLLLSFTVLLTACSEPAPVQPNPVVAAPLDEGSFVINNAHIIDGTGRVFEQGSVVIKDGLIISVSEGASTVPGAMVIDAQGKTVMPGFIEGHRHLIEGNPDQWMAERAAANMQEFLDAGFTTILSAIDAPQILELRRMLAAGEMVGPRILSGAFMPVAIPAPSDFTGDPARTDVSRPPARPTVAAGAIPDADTIAGVQRIKDAGYDMVKTVVTVTPNGPEIHTLTVMVEEAHRLGLTAIVHAVSVEDTLAVIQTRPDLLVHTPHIGQLTEAQAQTIASSGIPMTSTLGTFVPFYDANNLPIFRDAQPYPWNTLSSAGQGPVNARLLWEASIVYGYGTDTSFLPRDTFAHELKALHLTFSPLDIMKILTINTATAVGLETEIGTLEAGKVADIVMLDGDPLTDLYDLLNVTLVIKSGKVVVNKM